MYVERSILGRFASASRLSNVVAIVGPRQSGKTTFLKEQAKGLSSYVLFDDPDVREMFDEDIKKFESQYIQADRPTILDEVQYAKDPGRKLKYLADMGRRLWITSSSQALLRKETLGWLVGRVTILTLYQFSLEEFLVAKGQKETTEGITSRAIDEHMRYGGYPKVVLEEKKEDKETLLSDLYETMVLKDVARAFRIDDIAMIERMSLYLSHCVGNVLVYNSVSKELGLSFQSVKKYLDAMEKSYIIARVQPFYRNKLKEITKQPKVYFLDTGLRNAVAKDFKISQESRGKVFENYVFSELVKADMVVKFWLLKSRAEVDFIVEKGDRAIPVEVKLKSGGAEVERSMRSFIEEYKPRLGFVVFMEGKQDEVKKNGCTVKFVNVPALISQLKGL